MTRENIHGLYVNGLGDDKPQGQNWAVNTWENVGIDLEYYAVGWADKVNSFDQKLGKLCGRIDELYEDYGRAALVGSSAGASAVLNAFALRRDKIRAVITISGKIQQQHALKPGDLIKNPPFKESLRILPSSLEQLETEDLDRIMTAYPWRDQRVPVSDAQIPGAHHHRIHMIGHVPSIATALTIGKNPLAKFIHEQAN